MYESWLHAVKEEQRLTKHQVFTACYKPNTLGPLDSKQSPEIGVSEGWLPLKVVQGGQHIFVFQKKLDQSYYYLRTYLHYIVQQNIATSSETVGIDCQLHMIYMRLNFVSTIVSDFVVCIIRMFRCKRYFKLRKIIYPDRAIVVLKARGCTDDILCIFLICTY